MTTAWTAPPVERTDPDLTADERTSLEQWLDYQRATLLWKCAGLTADQLAERSVPPSALSLLGLVRHMVEVERWWFRMYADGQDVGYQYCTDDDRDADFDRADAAGAESDLQTYRQEVEAARAAVADRHLDDVVPGSADQRRRARDIRWIYVHMIEEYARHNGHADLIRERIDGVTGD
jgi:uncharacterized damage-inducible protein DinB